MALAADRHFAPIRLNDGESLRSRNDAFSFWKLPEEWRGSIAGSIDKSRVRAEHFLFERYITFMERRRSQRSKISRRWVDQPARRLSSRVEVRSRTRLNFPHWPCETALIEHWNRWLREVLEELQANDSWYLAFWPEGATCSVVLTHDICDSAQCAQIEAICELEEKCGFRSAWYLPLENLKCDWRRIDALRSRGFEFGVLSIFADGKELADEHKFRTFKLKVERANREHQLKGFRMRAGSREIGRISALNLDFESTFCDTDPFDLRPGGTCSVFPFFIGRSVELPITIPRDHTLIHLLRRNPLAIWSLKSQWIANAGGMILAATEPHYLSAEPYLGAYKGLLKELSELEAWRALPSEVAAWWRNRDQASLISSQSKPVVAGSEVSGVVVRRLSEASLLQ
jgi:hypothetical protein